MPAVLVFTCLGNYFLPILYARHKKGLFGHTRHTALSVIFIKTSWSDGRTSNTGLTSGPRDLFFLTFNPHFVRHCSNFTILNIITFPTVKIAEQKFLKFQKLVLSSASLIVFTWIPCVQALRRLARDKPSE